MNTRLTVDIPLYGGLIVPVQVFESDDEGSGKREELLREFENGFHKGAVDERSNLLDAIARAYDADWRPESISAYAFRRRATVETV